MNLLFASLPTYDMTLDFEQSYWYRARRLSVDLVFERVSGALPPAGKKSLCDEAGGLSRGRQNGLGIPSGGWTCQPIRR